MNPCHLASEHPSATSFKTTLMHAFKRATALLGAELPIPLAQFLLPFWRQLTKVPQALPQRALLIGRQLLKLPIAPQQQFATLNR